MRKKLLISVGVFAGLLVVGIVAAAVMIDSIVKAGTETAATAALKVPTKLKGATIQYAGHATLDEFEIGNPEGYKEPRAVAFEKFDASLRTHSLLEDVVDVSDVLVTKPELTIEFKGTKSNWSVLMDNLASITAGNLAKDDTGKKEDAKGGKKFRIERLRVEGAKVRFRSDLIPGGAHAITLAPFELRNIGSSPGGASMGEVLSTLLHSLGGEAAKGGGSLPEQLLGSFKSELTGTGTPFQKAVETTTQQLKDAGKTLQDDAKKLFGPKK